MPLVGTDVTAFVSKYNLFTSSLRSLPPLNFAKHCTAEFYKIVQAKIIDPCDYTKINLLILVVMAMADSPGNHEAVNRNGNYKSNHQRTE